MADQSLVDIRLDLEYFVGIESQLNLSRPES